MDHCPAARRGAVVSRGPPGLRLEYRALRLRAKGDPDGAVSGELPADPLRRRAIAAARRSILSQRQSEAIGDDAFHRLEEEFDWAELSAQA
jgi:monovalent cation/hydrogen antiporter